MTQPQAVCCFIPGFFQMRNPHFEAFSLNTVSPVKISAILSEKLVSEHQKLSGPHGSRLDFMRHLPCSYFSIRNNRPKSHEIEQRSQR
jgi:hypothetical protein